MKRILILFLLLADALVGAAAPVEKPQAAVWIEAETSASAKGLVSRKEKFASGGVLLGVHGDQVPGVTAKWVLSTGPIAAPMNLIVRYASQFSCQPELAIDGTDAGTITLPSTKGFGHKADEWSEAVFALPRGLEAGRHTLTLRTGFGSRPFNLDRLGLVHKEGWQESVVVENANQVIALSAWESGSGDSHEFKIGQNMVVKRDGRGGAAARFYPADPLPAVFQRTLVIDEWPSGNKGLGVQWIFTGPEGGFTVSITESSVRLTQRYYNSYGLNELIGRDVKPGHFPERKWLDDTVEYHGPLQAVTVEMGANLQLVLRLNGREALRQKCLLDVHQHQIVTYGGDRVRLLSPPPRAVSVTIDRARRFQTMLGFGGIGTPPAYAMLSPEGKRRWWKLVAQYNLRIQREYPIGTHLQPEMDNWNRLTDATPHGYGDNFPNGEISDFDYIKTIRKLGGMVWFEFWALPPWTNPKKNPADAKQPQRPRLTVDLDQYAQAVVGYCQASRTKVGVPPEVVGVQNEIGRPAAEHQQMTLALRRALDAAGLQAVKIHLSDDGYLAGGIQRAKAARASEAAWKATDYVASHLYDYQDCFENPDRFDNPIGQWNAATAGKPFLSTEICVNYPKYQVPSYRLALVLGQLYHKNLALMNAEAICYCWTLLNAVQPSYGWTRTLFVPDLSHGGVPVAASHQLRVFGAFSRRVCRGMTRIGADSSDKDLLATAFQGAEGATVVLLNRGVTPCRVSLQGLEAFREMEVVDLYHENAVQPAPKGEVMVAPGSFVTLTSVALGRLPADFAIDGLTEELSASHAR